MFWVSEDHGVQLNRVRKKMNESNFLTIQNRELEV